MYSMNGIYIIVAFLVGWTAAHIVKLLILVIKERGRASFSTLVKRLLSSGGMPSGHTASLSAAVMFTGLAYGFDSPVFAISVCILSIIIYDAINVRYAVGQQGKVVNKLLKKVNSEDEVVKVVEGHTLLEVTVGLLLGLLMGWITYIVVVKMI